MTAVQKGKKTETRHKRAEVKRKNFSTKKIIKLASTTVYYLSFCLFVCLSVCLLSVSVSVPYEKDAWKYRRVARLGIARVRQRGLAIRGQRTFQPYCPTADAHGIGNQRSMDQKQKMACFGVKHC